MTMRERFEFVFDVTGNKQAAKAFADVGKAADKAGAQATTNAGKFADFAKGAAPYVGTMASVATAAFAAVGKFEKLGLAVGRFSDATKLSTEQSSRWIEVAHDLGIGADTIQTAIGKMEKALATTPAKFQALGVAIAHTSDGAVDVQGTFLNAIDVVNRMRDPLARSKAASDLFGKSWQSMSELIGMGSSNIKTALAGVADAKILSPEEVARAKAYREAMDKLHDAFEELVLTVGEELIPALTTVANTLGTIAKVGVPVAKHVGEIFSAATGGKADGWHRATTDILMFGTPEVTRGIRNVARAIGGLFGDGKAKDEVEAVDIAVLQFTADAWKMRDAGIANAEAWAVQADKHDLLVAAQMRGNHAQEEFNATTEQTAKETKKAADEAARLDQNWSNLFGLFDTQQAVLDAQDAAKQLSKLAKRGKLTPADVLNYKQDTARQFQAIGMTEAQFKVSIIPLIDEGEYDKVAFRLAVLTAQRNVQIDPSLTKYSGGSSSISQYSSGKKSATGGLVDSNGSWVGERGAEWFQPASAGRIFTSGELARAVSGGGSSGGTVNIGQIVIQGGSVDDGRKVVEAIKQYERMAGSGWRN